MAASPHMSSILKQWIPAGGAFLADLVFPPVCAGCGVRTGRNGGLCGDCWASLHFIEPPLCDVMGTPFSYDMGKGIISAEAIAEPPPFSRLRSVVLYDDVARSLVHRLKYKDRTELGRLMAGWMTRAGKELIAEAEAIIPAPLHWRRRLARGYNQSAELGRAVAELSGKTYLPTALMRRKNTRPQVGLGAAARRDNLRGAFVVPDNAKPDIFGRRLLLIDDVYTTGATARAATAVLLRAGAQDVSVLTFARVAAG